MKERGQIIFSFTSKEVFEILRDHLMNIGKVEHNVGECYYGHVAEDLVEDENEDEFFIVEWSKGD